MVKGSKRQIIFLPNLRDAGRGIFECAYFVLRADRGDGDVGENEMLLEAERIVAEAERLHGRDRSAGRGKSRTSRKAAAHSRMGGGVRRRAFCGYGSGISHLSCSVCPVHLTIGQK